MRHYLLKTYDSAGRLIGRADYRAATDEEAAGVMPPTGENRWSELWCGPRLVGLWDGAEQVMPPRQSARGRMLAAS
jgi:hypothetical protein